MLKHIKKQKGQGMVEYIVIVALVGLAAIAGFSYFGGAVVGQVGQMGEQVAGGSSTSGQQAALKDANSVVTDAASHKLSMSNYEAKGNN